MAQADVIRDFMVALGFKADNSGLGKMQDVMNGVAPKAVALKGALLSLATGLDKRYISSPPNTELAKSDSTKYRDLTMMTKTDLQVIVMQVENNLSPHLKRLNTKIQAGIRHPTMKSALATLDIVKDKVGNFAQKLILDSTSDVQKKFVDTIKDTSKDTMDKVAKPSTKSKGKTVKAVKLIKQTTTKKTVQSEGKGAALSTVQKSKKIISLVEIKGAKRVYKMGDGATETRTGGTVAWRNNNPGNLKFDFKGSADKSSTLKRSKDKALRDAQKRYAGVVALDQWGNAIFETMEAGAVAKAKLLKQQHSGKTFPEMLRSYAKNDYSGKTNYKAYEATINRTATAKGVSLKGKKIGEMSQAEFAALAAGMVNAEGVTVGQVSRTGGLKKAKEKAATKPSVVFKSKTVKTVKPIKQKAVVSVKKNTKKTVGVELGVGKGKASVKSGKYVFSFGKDVDTYIKEASVKYGIDEKILRGFVKMEAGWTGKMSPTGAIGTGQFTQDTWNGLAATKAGKEIGMTKIGKRFRTSADPRYDKRINTLATGLLAKQNTEILKKYGLPATGENLYLAHNIGPVTFAKAYTGKGANAEGIKAMRQNLMMKGETPKQFVKRQASLFKGHYDIANKQYEESNSIKATVGQASRTSSQKKAKEKVNKPSVASTSKTDNAVNPIKQTATGRVKKTTKKAVGVELGVGKAVQGGVKGAVTNGSGFAKTAPIKSGAKGEKQIAFIKKYWGMAIRISEALDVNPELILSQFAAETGWGKSIVPGTNNLGNIKAGKSWKGKTVKAYDKIEKSNDPYRVYATPEEFADDYIKFVGHSKRYKNVIGSHTAEKFYTELKKSGYATDKNYVSKGVEVNKYIMNRLDMTKVKLKQAKTTTPQNSKDLAKFAQSANMPNIQSYAPPTGNPNKGQLNSSNMSASNVTIHQTFQTDMTLNGVNSPMDLANAVQRQQENSLVFMARGAQSVLT